MTSNSKEWIQYLVASIMVLSGIVLAFFSFFINGDVTDGVLWYVGQGLTFAGGVFGVSVYFRTKLGQAKTEIEEILERKIKEVGQIKAE